MSAMRIFRCLRGPKYGCIDFFPGICRKWKMSEAQRMGDDFPPTVELTIHEDSGYIVGDFVNNIGQSLIVSARARALLEAEGLVGDEVEYLPFGLKNKNGCRIRSTSFAFANILRTVPCLDRQRSNFRATDDGTSIVVMKVMHLHPDRIPEHLKVIRAAEYPELFLFREDLIARIEQAGLTGFRSLPLGANLRDE